MQAQDEAFERAVAAIDFAASRGGQGAIRLAMDLDQMGKVTPQQIQVMST